MSSYMYTNPRGHVAMVVGLTQDLTHMRKPTPSETPGQPNRFSSARGCTYIHEEDTRCHQGSSSITQGVTSVNQSTRSTGRPSDAISHPGSQHITSGLLTGTSHMRRPITQAVKSVNRWSLETVQWGHHNTSSGQHMDITRHHVRHINTQ